jgi:hypothetical protein
MFRNSNRRMWCKGNVLSPRKVSDGLVEEIRPDTRRSAYQALLLA